MHIERQLGINPALVGAAAGALSQGGGGGGGGGGGSGGIPSSGAGQPSTTMSPAFQQQLTPQISPVFQQMQDSAGSTQQADPTMTATGGQRADTAGASGGPAAPRYPDSPGGVPISGGRGYPTVQQSTNWGGLIKGALVIGGVAVAIIVYNNY